MTLCGFVDDGRAWVECGDNFPVSMSTGEAENIAFSNVDKSLWVENVDIIIFSLLGDVVDSYQELGIITEV